MTELKFMPHQQKALDLTEGKNRVAYYLDMGLGKTFVGAEKMYLLNNSVNIVICQKSKITDWIEHFNTYYPDYSVFDLTKKVQAVRFRELVDTDKVYDYDLQIVGVINYDLAFRRSYIANIRDFTLLLDESSLISNETAKRSKFILKLNPESVVLLSGTPTAGKYERLWSQCKLLGWDIQKKAFWNSYVETQWIDQGGFNREVVTGYKNVSHLKKKLAEHGCVFMKTTDAGVELPEQVEQNIFVKSTKEYRYFIKNSYLQLSRTSLQEFELDSDFWGSNEADCIELVGDNSLTKTLYARQLCGQYHKEKLQALRDLVQSTEDRIIIFYNFNEELRQMQNHLQEVKRHFAVLNGQSKDLQAYHLYDDSITFIQYQAGAMGGNFQKANKIIYFTLPLGKGSCDLWEQSKKRIHRIGQKSTCFYYYLLVKGSVEEKNLAALIEGKELTDELFTEA